MGECVMAIGRGWLAWLVRRAVLALILGACPLCTQPLTLDRLAAALAGT
jgi:hypothetical protein